MNRMAASVIGVASIALVSLGVYVWGDSGSEGVNEAEIDQHGDHDDENAGADNHGGEDADGPELKLSIESLAEAGIRIEVLEPVVLNSTVLVPAEIRPNGYQSSVITPRIPAIVVERHARLSDVVETGTPLVTLFSRDVASAEGEFLVADREWRRVRNLGREVVSERRYLDAQVARTQAEALLLSFGLGRTAIDAVVAVRRDRKSVV